MIFVHAKSQYDSAVHENYRPSACGPTAIEAILRYYTNQSFDINTLYKQLGVGRFGISMRKIVRRLPTIIGPGWDVRKIPLADVLQSLDKKQPVAMKFDRYFTPFFYKKAQYHFHWTVLVGYTIENNRLLFFVEDLGTPRRASRVQKIDYLFNRHALTFVLIRPLNEKSSVHDLQ